MTKRRTTDSIIRLFDYSTISRSAFTLVELMLVIAIMGLMGTLSVGGYRAMRRGMEERGVMQNASQFVRNAYQRAMIDGQPTAVYFWNETRQVESDDGSEPLVVVGHAVAVRRAGRVSAVGADYLMDEFGDLKASAGMDESTTKYTSDDAKKGSTTYIYKINGNEDSWERSIVGVATMPVEVANLVPMTTDEDWQETNRHGNEEIMAYAYCLRGGDTSWNIGDAYGFEFAELTLPNNYIFGGEGDYEKKDLKKPVKEVKSTILHFGPGLPDAGNQRVVVSAIRPGKTGGAPEAQEVDKTVSVTASLSDQNR